MGSRAFVERGWIVEWSEWEFELLGLGIKVSAEKAWARERCAVLGYRVDRGGYAEETEAEELSWIEFFDPLFMGWI